MKAVAVPVADECRLLQYYHAVPVPPYLCRFALTHRRRRRLLSSLVTTSIQTKSYTKETKLAEGMVAARNVYLGV